MVEEGLQLEALGTAPALLPQVEQASQEVDVVGEKPADLQDPQLEQQLVLVVGMPSAPLQVQLQPVGFGWRIEQRYFRGC